MWIMWITRCITTFCRENWDLLGVDKNGGIAQENVDNVDKLKIEQIFCAICQVYHNVQGFCESDAMTEMERISHEPEGNRL